MGVLVRKVSNAPCYTHIGGKNDMRTRWKIFWASLTTAAVLVSGVALIAFHGRHIQNAQEEQTIRQFRAHYDHYFDNRERPPLEDLYVRLRDPARSSGAGVTIRLIASYGRSDASSKALLDFIQMKLPPEHRGSGLTKGQAMALLGLTGGETALSILKQIFANANGSPALSLEAWMEEVIGKRTESPRFFLNEIRMCAAVGLLISGPEGNALVRQHFFEQRDAFEKNELTEDEKIFVLSLVGALTRADEVGLYGPNVLLVPHGGPYWFGSRGTKYLPRLPEFALERAAIDRHPFRDLRLALQTGLRDLLVK